MQRLTTLTVAVALISPTVALGQDYTFGDWARDHGFSAGDVMPAYVNAGCWPGPCSPGIDSLDGVTDLDWTTTPTWGLDLWGNQISSIESGDFSGLGNLIELSLYHNQITDLSPLHVMDDLTDLWFVNTQNADAIALDDLLDNLETIESPDTEGVLYMTEADYDAFNAAGGGLLSDWNDEEGHHVEFLQIGDVNHDTEVNGLDVDPFVDVLLSSRFDVAADVNGDGAVNGLDVDPFVAAVVGGGAAAVPEPSTLLVLVTLGLAGTRQKWRG